MADAEGAGTPVTLCTSFKNAVWPSTHGHGDEAGKDDAVRFPSGRGTNTDELDGIRTDFVVDKEFQIRAAAGDDNIAKRQAPSQPLEKSPAPIRGDNLDEMVHSPDVFQQPSQPLPSTSAQNIGLAKKQAVWTLPPTDHIAIAGVRRDHVNPGTGERDAAVVPEGPVSNRTGMQGPEREGGVLTPQAYPQADPVYRQPVHNQKQPLEAAEEQAGEPAWDEFGPVLQADVPAPAFEIVPGGLRVVGGGAQDRGGRGMEELCVLFCMCVVVIGVAIILVLFVRELQAASFDIEFEEATIKTTRVIVETTTAEEDYSTFKRAPRDKNNGETISNTKCTLARTAMTIPEVRGSEVYVNETPSSVVMSKNDPQRFNFIDVTTNRGAEVSLLNYSEHSSDTP